MSAPFIAHAIMTSPSSAWSRSSAFTNAGVASSGARSSPRNVTCFAPAITPAFSKTFFNGTPVQRAVAELAAVRARREKAAAVTRTLVDRDEFDRVGDLLEIGERKIERLIH